MLIRFLLLGLPFILFGCAGASMEADGPPRLGPDRSVIDNVRATDQLTTLSALLEQVEMSETLAGAGPYTLFAPADAAFAALTDSVRADLLRISGPATYNLLAYHLVPRRIDGDGSFRTVHGGTLQLAVHNGTRSVGPHAILNTLPARNGTVYIIDGVLIPPGAQD